MPEDIDADLWKFDGVFDIRELEWRQTLHRVTLRNRGDHVRIRKDVPDGDEMRHGKTNVSANAFSLDHFVYFRVSRSRGNDDDVVGLGELLEGNFFPLKWMTLAKHAYVRLLEQAALHESSLQLWQQAHCKIDLPCFHRVP